MMIKSCEKATELIEKGKIVKLTQKERIQLGVHLSMCSGCRNYNKQSEQIDDFLNQISDEQLQGLQLTDEAKEKLLSKLREE